GRDESESLCIVEPLHCTSRHTCSLRNDTSVVHECNNDAQRRSRVLLYGRVSEWKPDLSHVLSSTEREGFGAAAARRRSIGEPALGRACGFHIVRLRHAAYPYSGSGTNSPAKVPDV